MNTSSGEDGREGEKHGHQAKELRRGNVCDTARGARRTLTLSRCFSKAKYVVVLRETSVKGFGKIIITDKSLKIVLSGKFHLGTLKKNDPQTQHYVKQEKETNGDLLI